MVIGMRICFYTETALPRVSGQELVIDALAREFSARDHEVRVVTLRRRTGKVVSDQSAASGVRNNIEKERTAMSRKPKPPSLLRRFRRLFSFKRHYRRRLNRRYIVEGMQLLNDVGRICRWPAGMFPRAPASLVHPKRLRERRRSGCRLLCPGRRHAAAACRLPSLERAGFQRWYRFVNNGGEVTEWSLKRGTVKFEFFWLFPDAIRFGTIATHPASKGVRIAGDGTGYPGLARSSMAEARQSRCLSRGRIRRLEGAVAR